MCAPLSPRTLVPPTPNARDFIFESSLFAFHLLFYVKTISQRRRKRNRRIKSLIKFAHSRFSMYSFGRKVVYSGALSVSTGEGTNSVGYSAAHHPESVYGVFRSILRRLRFDGEFIKLASSTLSGLPPCLADDKRNCRTSSSDRDERFSLFR